MKPQGQIKKLNVQNQAEEAQISWLLVPDMDREIGNCNSTAQFVTQVV